MHFPAQGFVSILPPDNSEYLRVREHKELLLKELAFISPMAHLFTLLVPASARSFHSSAQPKLGTWQRRKRAAAAVLCQGTSGMWGEKNSLLWGLVTVLFTCTPGSVTLLFQRASTCYGRENRQLFYTCFPQVISFL